MLIFAETCYLWRYSTPVCYLDPNADQFLKNILSPVYLELESTKKIICVWYNPVYFVHDKKTLSYNPLQQTNTSSIHCINWFQIVKSAEPTHCKCTCRFFSSLQHWDCLDIFGELTIRRAPPYLRFGKI